MYCIVYTIHGFVGAMCAFKLGERESVEHILSIYYETELQINNVCTLSGFVLISLKLLPAKHVILQCAKKVSI